MIFTTSIKITIKIPSLYFSLQDYNVCYPPDGVNITNHDLVIFYYLPTSSAINNDDDIDGHNSVTVFATVQPNFIWMPQIWIIMKQNSIKLNSSSYSFISFIVNNSTLPWWYVRFCRKSRSVSYIFVFIFTLWAVEHIIHIFSYTDVWIQHRLAIEI